VRGVRWQGEYFSANTPGVESPSARRGLSRRLRYMQPADAEALESRYSELVRGLQKLLTALRTRPEA
jgi:hypothetical protein